MCWNARSNIHKDRSYAKPPEVTAEFPEEQDAMSEQEFINRLKELRLRKFAISSCLEEDWEEDADE